MSRVNRALGKTNAKMVSVIAPFLQNKIILQILVKNEYFLRKAIFIL